MKLVNLNWAAPLKASSTLTDVTNVTHQPTSVVSERSTSQKCEKRKCAQGIIQFK